MNDEGNHRFNLDNDLAEKTEEQIEKEIMEMAKRAERIRRRLRMNRAIILPTGNSKTSKKDMDSRPSGEA